MILSQNEWYLVIIITTKKTKKKKGEERRRRRKGYMAKYAPHSDTEKIIFLFF